MTAPYIGAHAKTNRAWVDMRARCRNPNHAKYKYYGARGITVDPAWESFHNFLNDMGYAPSPDLSLERRDNNANYDKENCIWADKFEQQRNRRSRPLDPDSGITYDETSGLYIARSSLIILYKGESFDEAKTQRLAWVELNKKWKIGGADT